MKNKAKLFGIIAMVAVIGLSVSACQMGDDGSNNGNNGGDTKGGGNDVNDGFLGATLDLNGWVYMIEWTADYDVIFTQFPVGENRTFSSNFGVNGAIADGQLSFTIGRPAEAHMWSIAYLFGMWTNAEDFATFSDPEARFAELSLTMPGGSIERYYISISQDGMSGSITGSMMYTSYIFVDRDVTVTMGSRMVWEEDEWGIIATEPFALAFREGWNAVNIYTNVKAALVEIHYYFEEVTTTVSMGDLGHPIRWVFEGTLGYMVSPLTLSGQVWTRDWDGDYSPFTGNMTVSPWLVDADGAITNGHLSFTTDWLSSLGNAENAFSFLRDNFTFTLGPENARASTLILRATTPRVPPPNGLPIFGFSIRDPDPAGRELSRQQSVHGDSENGRTETHDEVHYIYVERNITVTGRSQTADTDDLNITLTAGWNTVHLRRQVVQEWYPESIHYEAITVSTLDPPTDEVKWVLQEW